MAPDVVQNPPKDMPRIMPAVFYDDAGRAIEWLENAFGFRARDVIRGPDGTVVHSELEFAEGLIFVGPSSAYAESASPASLEGRYSQGLYVYVDDVDAHFARARAAGAAIDEEPVDRFFGDRVYRARDLEGHAWTFGQHVRDLSPEELAAAAKAEGIGSDD